MRDLTLGMMLFEQVHGSQLVRAHEMLMWLPRDSLWRIILWEESLLVPDGVIPDDELCADVITVKLDHHDKLMPADEASERAINEWEKRYATKRYTFDPPDFH